MAVTDHFEETIEHARDLASQFFRDDARLVHELAQALCDIPNTRRIPALPSPFIRREDHLAVCTRHSRRRRGFVDHAPTHLRDCVARRGVVRLGPTQEVDGLVARDRLTHTVARENRRGASLKKCVRARQLVDRLGSQEKMVIEQIGRLDRREGAREIIRRIALRAGVELDPAACWLLARLSEHAPVSLSTLADRAHVEVAALDRARDRLLELGLIAPDLGATSSHEPTAPDPDAALTYGLTAAGHSTLESLKATGEERLRDLLECWRPDQHADLARLIANLAHEFFIDDSALRKGVQTHAAAVAS